MSCSSFKGLLYWLDIFAFTCGAFAFVEAVRSMLLKVFLAGESLRPKLFRHVLLHLAANDLTVYCLKVHVAVEVNDEAAASICLSLQAHFRAQTVAEAILPET